MNGVCENEILTIERCQRGSADAFEAIVDKYMKKAYFIAFGFVGNREDAMDLSQEAFFRAYYNINRLKSNRKFFPWFYQILKNLCFSHLRKQLRRGEQSLDSFGADSVCDGASEEFDPKVIAEKKEDHIQVFKAIGKLHEKHREVIVLRHFQNLSYEQIAEALFCNKGTVMSRLYHARRKLKEILNNQKGGPSA